MNASNLQLTSTLSSEGELILAIVDAPMPPMDAPDTILVEMLGAAINPSDIGLLIGPADPATARLVSDRASVRTVLTAPGDALAAQAKRLDIPMVAGNEGIGRVVAAGDAHEAQALIGSLVAVMGGGMYTRFRAVRVADSLALSVGTNPERAAGSLINPLTALGMVETMREEGFTALVHTAAASSLGQILCRLCQRDGIGLVNVVRSPDQVRLLKEIGAEHVCDMTSPSFEEDLARAIEATGAMLAFDALGGGPLAGKILLAMERAASNVSSNFTRYGSTTLKKIYLYGGLDTRPTEFVRNFGMAWEMGGWLLFTFMDKAGPAKVAQLKSRIAAELESTFATSYTRVISLQQACDPGVIAAYTKRATGEKFMIDPSK